jgi:hypothetical protein
LTNDDLNALNWTIVSQHTAAGEQLVITDAAAPEIAPRFYILRLVSEFNTKFQPARSHEPYEPAPAHFK